MTTGEYEKVYLFPDELRLDDQPGPAAHITRAKADALIARALLEAGYGPPAQAVEAPPQPVFGQVFAGPPANAPEPVAPARNVSTKPAPAPRRRSWLWQAAAVVVVCFAGMGSASAAVMLWKRIAEPEPEVTELPVEKQKPAKKRRVKAVSKAESAPVVLDELVIETEREKRKARRAPEDFLEDANRLRAARQWKQADEAYAKVWQEAPKSSAAYVARVASAAVRLEHLHDAKTALARYRAALEQSPRGPLLEEIRFGIAECYRALGQRAEERKALEAFVRDLPNSGLAQKARARLAQLQGKKK